MNLSKLIKPDAHALTPVSLLALALALLCLNATSAQAGTVSLARFGTCFTPPLCTVDIGDNSALDQNPAIGIIDFSVPVGQLPGGIFVASGRATEIITRDASGNVTGLFLSLTDTSVLGLLGGIGMPQAIPGQITLISNVPLASLNGVTGFVALSGQYESPDGHIQFADISAQTRLGGVLLGNVDPAAAVNVLSPVPFGGFDSREFGFPVNNFLFGIVNFNVSPNDGFHLPASAEFSATAVPEPTTMLLLGTGLAAAAIKTRKRLRNRKGA